MDGLASVAGHPLLITKMRRESRSSSAERTAPLPKRQTGVLAFHRCGQQRLRKACGVKRDVARRIVKEKSPGIEGLPAHILDPGALEPVDTDRLAPRHDSLAPVELDLEGSDIAEHERCRCDL